MPFQPKNKKTLFYLFLFFAVSLCFVFSDNRGSSAVAPDAIGIRIMPNPNHFSSLRWYRENIQKQGRPQSIKVDGYDAVRDGRTVYVNAANVDGGNMYTNIYIISYTQEPESSTVDIFGKLLEEWKFNKNVSADGVCSDGTGIYCSSDGDCPKSSYCARIDSAVLIKSEVVRDTKRLADITDMGDLLNAYFVKNGKYPNLKAGTYIKQNTLSVWPSWQITLGNELGGAMPADPVNKLGECPGYNPVTCWNEINKEFATALPGALPDKSIVYHYYVENNALNYRLCSFTETGLSVTGGFCTKTSSINNPPVIFTNFLPNGKQGQPYSATVSAYDVDGDPISWLLDTSASVWIGWGAPPILEYFNATNRKIISPGAGTPGTYDLKLTVSDGLDTAVKDYTIKVTLPCTDNDNDGYGVCPNCGQANGCAYDFNDCNDADKNVNPGAVDIYGNGIDDNCDGTIDEVNDPIPPQVLSFSVSPAMTSAEITALWSVQDNFYLKRVELWRTTDNAGSPNPANWIQVGSKDLSGLNASGNFTDNPPLGTWWYGVHVIDVGGNWGQEPAPPGPLKIIKIVCAPNGCNGDCPAMCTAAEDPDCGAAGCCGDGTCDVGENSATCLIDCPLVCIDNDGDGYGSPGSPVCAHPETDCDDFKSSVNPGAAEIFGNGIDDDCDGTVDEIDDIVKPVVVSFSVVPLTTLNSITATWSATDNYALKRAELWRTPDLSGAPDPAGWILAGSQNISGLSANGTFSDSPAVGVWWYGLHVIDVADNLGVEPPPGPIKVTKITCVPNGCNNDCPAGCGAADDPDCGTVGCCGDGTCDSGETWIICPADCPPICTDNDHDGYGSPGSPACPHPETDCNDSNIWIRPGAPEICGNGIDDDCVGGDLACVYSAFIDSPPNGSLFTKNAGSISFKGHAIAGTPPYVFSWSSSQNGALGAGEAITVNTSLLNAGMHTITLTATDSAPSPQTVTKSISIEIKPAGTLTARILMAETEFANGEMMNFTSSVSGGTAPYSYKWNSSIQGDFSNAANPSINTLITPWTIGIHIITLTVTDNLANTATDQITVIIPPLTFNVLPKEGEYFYFGENAALSAYNINGGTGPYTVQISSNKNGNLSTSGFIAGPNGAYNFNTSSLSEGNHTLTFTVTDSAGLVVKKYTNIQILPINPALVACFDFTDCDDANSCTTDICNNPGMMSSSCSNNTILACANGDGCCPAGCNSGNDNDCPVITDNDDPKAVLMVYNLGCNSDISNNDFYDSWEIQLYYELKRSVPRQNVLQLMLPSGCNNNISFSSMHSEIVTPIKNKLAALGEAGIYYILFTKNMPAETSANGYPRSVDNALMTPHNIANQADFPASAFSSNPYFENSPSIAGDLGRFSHAYKFGGNNMFLTTRLSEIYQIDRALYAEKYVYNETGYYNGSGYVDTTQGAYTDAYLDANYPIFSDVLAGSADWADRTMAYGKRIYAAKGWNSKWEATAKEIGEAGAQYTDATSALTAPNAMWYGGWNNTGQYLNALKWRAGAAAGDLSTDSGKFFLPKAIESGLTAGVGAIADAYLTGHPRPEVFNFFMLSGYNFAESAALSSPGVKWVNVASGDPVYNPNKAKAKLADSTAPIISHFFAVTSPTASANSFIVQAKIKINSAEPEIATFKVDYGLTTAYGNTANYDEIYTTEKDIAITGLAPNTTYNYRLTAKDPAGNTAVSANKTIKTTSDNSIIPYVMDNYAEKKIVDESYPYTLRVWSVTPVYPDSCEWYTDNGLVSNAIPFYYIKWPKGFHRISQVCRFGEMFSSSEVLIVVH